jgi:hypothetical protein
LNSVVEFNIDCSFLSEKNQPVRTARKSYNGYACFVNDNAINTYGTIGRPDGLFVMTKTDALKIIEETGSNMSLIEKRLGIPEGRWQSSPMRLIEIDKTVIKSRKIPNGFEGGAFVQEKEWIPGAHTKLGEKELVINQLSGSTIKDPNLIKELKKFY